MVMHKSTKLSRHRKKRLRDFADVLLEQGILSTEQLHEARRLVQRHGLSLKETLLKLGYAERGEILQAQANLHELDWIDLSQVTISPEVLDTVPESVARENVVLPLRIGLDVLEIAVSDPRDFDMLEKVSFILDTDLEPVSAPREQILEAIDRHYPPMEIVEPPPVVVPQEQIDAMRAVIQRVLAPRIFLCYRRHDSEFQAHYIYGKLTKVFGPDVFLDVDTLPPGVDFREFLHETVGSCDIVLALMGYHWLDSRTVDGTRRLDDKRDFVRIELEAALTRNIPIIPVLLGDLPMPHEEDLPGTLAKLAYRNANRLRASTFEKNTTKLIHDIERILQPGDGTDLDDAFELTIYPIERRVLQMIPVEFATSHNVLPVHAERGTLVLATDKPKDKNLLNRLHNFVTGKVVLLHVPAEEIRSAIAVHYRQSST